MKECYYCGELKKVRKESMDPLGAGNCLEWIGSRLISYIWICKDCDIAQQLLREHMLEEKKRKESIERKKWVTLRDKLLKKIKQ